MKKLDQFKEAIKNPPPERLAKIEYQSHFLQMIGISVVCVALLLKGFWYIIFAFIFGLGISYSQGMTALMKYRNIIAIVGKEPVKNYDKDISFTRRRDKIITHVYGSKAKLISTFLAVGFSFVFIGAQHSRIILSILYPVVSILFYIVIYYYFFYWVSYPLYQRDVNLNESKKIINTKRR